MVIARCEQFAWSVRTVCLVALHRATSMEMAARRVLGAIREVRFEAA